MAFLNTGYISKGGVFSKRNKIVLVIFLILIGIIAGVYISSRPVVALYKFNSGLNLSFDLNNWRLVPGSTSGDILENNSKDISIYLTSARPDDSSKTLTQIVEDRVSLLNKQNIEVKKESIKINSMDFYKIEYKDNGDENVKPDESSVSYLTLYNGIYTTFQIFYKTDTNIDEAIEIVNSVETN